MKKLSNAEAELKKVLLIKKTCIWAITGHELDTLCIGVHNSLTVHDNSWALKFDNFSEFQNVIGDSSDISDIFEADHKERSFTSYCFIFWMILFQFKNLL